jgi:hypothetical protein
MAAMRFLMLFAVCMAIVSAVSTCTTTTLSDYISMGNSGCTSNGLVQVNNIIYSLISSDGAREPTPNQLAVTPSFSFGPLNEITANRPIWEVSPEGVKLT